MVVVKFSFGPLETNTICIGCSLMKKAVVIDPAQGSLQAVLANAREQEFVIEKIFLTHSHWDHFADAYELKSKTGASLYVHPLDAKNLEHPGSDGIPLLIPVHPVTPDHFLSEGDLLEVGALQFEVIHSPGHSPGGVCFYSCKERLLISGDTLFRGSIGNLQLPTANAEEMWRSLAKLSKLPSETRVIPGHGGETSIGKEPWLSRARQIFSE
ncbi:MAG: MBL fold hydrolase [Chlamydiae bacterium RIFCSPHIGHO2_12_FULL_44_59]|nr:MAG: MBL fold hydrolase [Chlamydiae bacterium RIFCSPHIGHO2_01_FULL_44_39]OGN59252.1 MAG: MBL fold hydrolase [Chlamydiae bacterium RIFCSPHIGHO2_02_FULL_45_9]OGN60426.1 MAG: MBL fold hydrolase [Chlamydiae bacterium RIFCSPHIGHO2_12_FULL_44_59]OGN66547.1 MAG: MBL fold hydrolase [Chlamydiae bacterium RIFCSPLOWO2_01_FULL_44_52]OGN69861.1 MAG: MBL fold hydrolase [Chlamydiae bacterium RIFCSPLOWO2_02_FULL_45_22]OGN70472.1 MAG: MBL fold hydrolase [Chlamydiae bacterium RIFCSPLOWO2_12_FULL_45_20]